MDKHKDVLENYLKNGFDIVVIAASAGGLKALITVLSGLHSDFPAAIVVVQHLDPSLPSQMAHILGRRTALKVKQAEEGDQLQAGVVYIAPPDFHLMVDKLKRLRLSHSEKVHYVRPCGDLLFESAALVFQKKTLGLVLTGTGIDGTAGAKAIRKAGGKVIAQSEESSDFFGMPGSAIKAGEVDFTLPLEEISPCIEKLVHKGKN